MIISASRRTDIPAFYFDWFLKRIDAGFLYVKNPMNPKQISKIEINPENTDCIVFWTKNPIPIFERLNELEQYMYYFQFTLNDYSKEIECHLPSVDKRIEAFKYLAQMIGKERVIWRYDPILLTDDITVEYHLKNFEKIAHELQHSTVQVVVSVIDDYRKIRNNMKTMKIRSISMPEEEQLFNGIYSIANKYGLKISSCAETLSLEKYGITPGKCVDDQLISRLINHKISIKKDMNQRTECGCVESVEIGAYNTCSHGCKYCYANYSEDLVNDNMSHHDVNSPLLIGNIDEDAKVTIRKIQVFKD